MRGLPTWVWLVLATASGLGATYVGLGWFTSPPPSPETKALVVVAAQNLEPGAGLDGPVLRVERREVRPEGAFARKEELQPFEAAAAIKKGTPILPAHIRPRSQGLASRVHPGKRAMTVKVDEAAGLAGFPSPGNRVDVVLTSRQGEGCQKSRAETVLQNLLVLSHGPNMEKKPGDKPQAATTITLEVTPGEAERLAVAAQEGHISLVLRNQEDQGKALTTAPAMEGPAAAAPSSQVRQKTVEIIRKLKVDQELLPGPQGPTRARANVGG